jgi:hypothetical protein
MGTIIDQPIQLMHIQIDPGLTLEIPSSQLGHTVPDIFRVDFPYGFSSLGYI